jgi:hypothetical protein
MHWKSFFISETYFLHPFMFGDIMPWGALEVILHFWDLLSPSIYVRGYNAMRCIGSHSSFLRLIVSSSLSMSEPSKEPGRRKLLVSAKRQFTINWLQNPLSKNFIKWYIIVSSLSNPFLGSSASCSHPSMSGLQLENKQEVLRVLYYKYSAETRKAKE